MQGRCGRRRILRRRALGDAVRQLQHHRESHRARSGDLGHGLLRSEDRVRHHASVRRCVAQADDRSGAGAGEAEAGQPRGDAAGQAAAELRRDRRGAAGHRELRAGRTRGDGQGEHRHLREEGRPRLRLHPEAALDRCHRQLGRPVRLLPLRRSELHPDLPHARSDRLGLGGHDGRQGRPQHQRRAAHRGGRRQGPEVAQAEGDRARQLHRDPRAAPGGALPVADARRAQRARRRRGPQLHERQGARLHAARREGLRRQLHAAQRDRQSRSCGRRRSVRTAWPPSPSPGSRRASSRTCSTTATGRRGRRRSRPGRRRS